MEAPKKSFVLTAKEAVVTFQAIEAFLDWSRTQEVKIVKEHGRKFYEQFTADLESAFNKINDLLVDTLTEEK